MTVPDILTANMKSTLQISLVSGAVLVCRIDNVDDCEHDDAFAEIESVVEGLGRPHLVPGTYLRFFFSDITRIEKNGQMIYERGRA